MKNTLGQSVPINRSAWVVSPRHSKSYQKGGGIRVHVGSVQGIDTIRIFAQPITAGCIDTAKFTITLIDGLYVEITTAEDLCFNKFLVNWGDNQNAFLNAVTPGDPIASHTYERPGNYDITLTAYTPDTENSTMAVDVLWDLNYDGNRYVPFSFASNADCWGLYSVDPYDFWLEEPSRQSWYAARYLLSFPIWAYWQTRARFNVDLSVFAGHPSLTTGKCFMYMQGAFTAYIAYDDDAASKPRMHYYSGSDMGMTMFESKDVPYTTFQEIGSMVDNTTPMVPTTFGLLDQYQSEPAIAPPPILPDPLGQSDWDVNFRWSGWKQWDFLSIPSGNVKVLLQPYDEIRTKILPVTVA
jgi:hypothetical protein